MFSSYRQMSIRRFLVCLRQVINSEMILFCRKAGISFWKDGLTVDKDTIFQCLEGSLDIAGDDVDTR